MSLFRQVDFCMVTVARVLLKRTVGLRFEVRCDTSSMEDMGVEWHSCRACW